MGGGRVKGLGEWRGVGEGGMNGLRGSERDGWACSGDVAGRGRKRQADGRPGGQGRTVWADWDGRSVARPDRQADSLVHGRPCGRTAVRAPRQAN